MASAIVTVVAAAAVVFVSRGLTAWQRGDGRLQQLFEAEKALDGLGEDLRNSLSLADRPFEGTASALGFARAESSTQLTWVNYKLSSVSAGQTLVRALSLFPEESGEVPKGKTLVRGVVEFTVEYGALQQAEGTKAVQWVGTWASPGQTAQVPRLIRVTVRVDNPKGGLHSVTREYWIPHGALANPPAAA